MALDLENIRALAKVHDYIEIEMNKESKLISFRKGSTRINVYFTTGTVGTCLNHPKKGKTQLFRRNVSMDQLNDIFDNPRVHTGTGYYRKHITQKWKHRGNDNRDDFLVDSAMRWRYVGRATGLIKKEKDMKLICDICTLYDELFFEENSIPDLRNTRFECGSQCALMRIVFIFYKIKFGEFQIMDTKENKFQSFKGRPLEDLDKGLCEKGYVFLQDHQVQLMDLLTKFNSIKNNNIALELMNWLLGRNHAGHRFANLSGKQRTSPFSEKVESAHTEYGKLMYPKKAGLCPHCGIRYTDHEE